MKTMFILILAVTLSAHAQWSTDPTVNTPVCTAVGNQIYPQLINDGAGGTIITWTGVSPYAQRINVGGVIQWTANGVAISTANGGQLAVIVSDGAGGAIITWEYSQSGSNSDIYAQRINASGVVQWDTNGVAISTASYEQSRPTIASDGVGGAIITWEDSRSGSNYDIYAQRINASGVVQWDTNGVAISTASVNQQLPIIASDGAGGAIITWGDSNSDIYAQRINASGVVQWTADGVAISTASGTQFYPAIASDSAGGAIITWDDYRSLTNGGVYAQWINAAGAVQWTSNGVAISTTANGSQRLPTIVSDGARGAIITWNDFRNGAISAIYAQRINAAGAVQWTANGVAISTASGTNQGIPTIVTIISDGAGGAIITWNDFRNSVFYADIYAQRINATGVVQWTANGVAVSTASSTQVYPTIASDGSGGAIITWDDFRSGTNYDIYAQRVNSDGTLGGTTGVDNDESAPTEFSLQQNYPNPFNPSTSIQYAVSSNQFVQLKVYDVLGKEVATLVNEEKSAGSYEINFSAIGGSASGGNAFSLASGIYFYKLQTGTFVETKKMILLK